jgi:hypothetical protein
MLNPRSFLLDAWRTLSLIGISISLAVTSVGAQAGNAPGVRAAGEGNAAVSPDLAFDVVSIRPAPDTGDRSFATRGDEYRAIRMPLGFTILQAYFPPRMGSKDRIIGAPTWVWNDSYEFVGKVGETHKPGHKTRSNQVTVKPGLQPFFTIL